MPGYKSSRKNYRKPYRRYRKRGYRRKGRMSLERRISRVLDKKTEYKSLESGASYTMTSNTYYVSFHTMQRGPDSFERIGSVITNKGLHLNILVHQNNTATDLLYRIMLVWCWTDETAILSTVLYDTGNPTAYISIMNPDSKHAKMYSVIKDYKGMIRTKTDDNNSWHRLNWYIPLRNIKTHFENDTDVASKGYLRMIVWQNVTSDYPDVYWQSKLTYKDD